MVGWLVSELVKKPSVMTVAVCASAELIRVFSVQTGTSVGCAMYASWQWGWNSTSTSSWACASCWPWDSSTTHHGGSAYSCGSTSQVSPIGQVGLMQCAIYNVLYWLPLKGGNCTTRGRTFPLHKASCVPAAVADLLHHMIFHTT